MIDLNKNDIQGISGGMSQQIPVDRCPPIIVSRPQYTDKPDGYPWIRPPYEPEPSTPVEA